MKNVGNTILKSTFCFIYRGLHNGILVLHTEDMETSVLSMKLATCDHLNERQNYEGTKLVANENKILVMLFAHDHDITFKWMVSKISIQI